MTSKPDLTPEEFRRYGYQVIDWIAGYLDNAGSYPVLPAMQPGDLAAQLPAAAPEESETMDSILNDFDKLIVPALTHWNHPRFHAYFANSSTGPGILAEALCAAVNVNGMLWKSAPAATELEQVTLGWLRQWLGLPRDWFGIIYDTASISSMHAIAAAREMADPEIRRRGSAAGLVLYTSQHAHSSIEKAAITLGIGQDNVRKIPVDDQFRLQVADLKSAVEADAAVGKKPFCVVPTVGTTSTSSIDPVAAVAEIAEAHGMWMHVDAAYGGSAAVVPEYQQIVFDGVHRAHSLVVNPHKWLFTPMDISVFYTREPEILRRAFSLSAEYLKTAEDTSAVNYMDYGIQLGRRFRALKLWFVMRYFGHLKIAQMLRNHIEWAQRLAKLIRAHPDFEVVAPTPFSLICFRHRGTDEQNRALLERINATGKSFLSHTVLNGRYVLRLAIGNIATTWHDLEQTWKTIQNESHDTIHFHPENT
jgi:aromatic-L-amino-acid decarboxylase